MAASKYAPRFIRTKDIDGSWPWLGPYLRRALSASSELTIDDLYVMAKADKARLWVISETPEDWPSAVAATGERDDGSVEIIAIAGLKGRMVVWMDTALRSFESMAREVGKNRVVIQGRKGWQRCLPGYRLVETLAGGRVVMEKVL